MIHRFPRFHSTESLCGLSYGQVCRLNHAYVIVDHDAGKVTCPNCLGIQQSPRQSNGVESAAATGHYNVPPTTSPEARGSSANLVMDADDALGVAFGKSVRGASGIAHEASVVPEAVALSGRSAA